MVIDTSAYSELQKGNRLVLDVIATAKQLIVPIVVVGELRYGFLNGTKADENEKVLQKFLATEGVEVANTTMKTSKLYAELYLHAKKRGKVLSHNGLWVAAIAQQLELPLITTDKDFAVLRPKLACNIHIVEPTI